MTPTEFQKRYQYDPVADKLGSCNGGVVYKAFDRVSKRDVVIKAKLAPIEGSEDDFSLKDDYSALQTIPQHRNIANYETFYTIQTEKGIFDFTIMPYYKDGNLAKQIQIGMTPAQKEVVARELLDGISVLHAHKIVHCDIKPSNILTIRKPKEIIPLISFGMGHSEEPASLRYSAPEMISTQRVHYCVDLWSYGVILYEIFCEKPLFEVSDEQFEQQILSTDIEGKLQQMPMPWRQVAERCLVYDPRQRVQSTRELMDILARSVAEATPVAVPQPILPQQEQAELAPSAEEEAIAEAPEAPAVEPPAVNTDEATSQPVVAPTEAPETPQEPSAEPGTDNDSSSTLLDLARTAEMLKPDAEEAQQSVTEESAPAAEPPAEAAPAQTPEPNKTIDQAPVATAPVETPTESTTETPLEPIRIPKVKKSEEAPATSTKYWGTQIAQNEETTPNTQSATEGSTPNDDDTDLHIGQTPMETDPFIPLNDEGNGKRAALIIGIALLVIIGIVLIFIRHVRKGSSDDAIDSTALIEQTQLMLDDQEEESAEKEYPSRTQPIGSDATSCGTVTDIDGNTYQTVQIGTQCWMKENLRTKRLPNGDSLVQGKTHNAKMKLYYGQSPFGNLYNWKAATNGEAVTTKKGKHGKKKTIVADKVQGICPEGWHLPSQAELKTLTQYVSKNYAFSGDETYIGKALAGTSNWKEESTPNTVGHNQGLNNVTGFSAQPSGSYCDYYLDSRRYANYWSATPGDNGAYCMQIGYDSKGAAIHTNGKDVGLSVRCLKD